PRNGTIRSRQSASGAETTPTSIRSPLFSVVSPNCSYKVATLPLIVVSRPSTAPTKSKAGRCLSELSTVDSQLSTLMKTFRAVAAVPIDKVLDRWLVVLRELLQPAPGGQGDRHVVGGTGREHDVAVI